MIDGGSDNSALKLGFELECIEGMMDGSSDPKLGCKLGRRVSCELGCKLGDPDNWKLGCIEGILDDDSYVIIGVSDGAMETIFSVGARVVMAVVGAKVLTFSVGAKVILVGAREIVGGAVGSSGRRVPYA